MRVVTDLRALERRPRAVAIGTFDGVHAGHRAVIARAMQAASELDLTSSVLTFDRHPLAVVAPDHVPQLLTTQAEKTRLIAELGPEELVVLSFDEKLAALEPEEFCEEVLVGALDVRFVVIGENFSFGAGGRGDAATLAACGERHGFEAVAVTLVTDEGHAISSTRIRRLLREGVLEEVRQVLGRPPTATGRVVHGVRRGRTLGFPTANIDVEAGLIFPGRGVYAARVLVDGRWYRAAVNIGHNPTFRAADASLAHVSIEAFLLGFVGDIYDHAIRVDFLHKLRDERRFDEVDALVAQMHSDIGATAALRDPAFSEVGL
jgi:riboflavin kinase / FMN adenylyltransferase